jgi:hypothetical protein
LTTNTSASITQAEYSALAAAAMTEKQLQDVITALANRTGWLVYHTHDSRRSQAGYPDLHLVHAGRRLSLFRELKTMKGKQSLAQLRWMSALLDAGVDAAVWRPIDWYDGTILALLAPDPTR